MNGSFLSRTLTSRASAQEFGRIANGITRFGLTLDATRNLPILLPPLPEQRVIAAVLDSIDDAIEGAEAVIAATEQLRDSLLHNLLTRGVPGWHTEWKDVPGLGTIPADWRWCGWGRWRRWKGANLHTGLETSPGFMAETFYLYKLVMWFGQTEGLRNTAKR